MGYELQKVILEKGNVYNIFFDSRLLGHVLIENDTMILAQTDEVPIIPLVESFGFAGEAHVAEPDGYSKINLKPTPEFTPLYEYKVLNLPECFLTESEI